MKLIKPKKLPKNGVIGIISPASAVESVEKIEKGVKYLEKLGYRVEVGKNVGKNLGYLAGKDEERLEDLHDMFRNKNINAVICVRGGYGTGRLLNKIDFNLIKKNPKIFVGYSDITTLQMSFLQKAKLVTFAGPMVAVDFWEDEVDSFTEENFWRIITSNKKIGKLQNPNAEKFFTLVKGQASGELMGGNLALVTSIMGSEYLPPFKGKILLLEDVDEKPYRIDRMFNQLRLAKAFKQIKGVILGRFVDCYEDINPTLSLNEVIADYFNKMKIPVIYNFKHGHIKQNITIPWGLKCNLNSTKGIVDIPESAVV